MCSICGVATDEPDPSNVASVVAMLARTRHRGPDGCGLHAGGEAFYAPDPEALAAKVRAGKRASRVVLGQSRLAITGALAATPPYVSEDGALALAHNGEVYNHKELEAIAGAAATGCDSEVLMHALESHYKATRGLREAMRRTVEVASGMYALAATDGKQVVLARDAIGKKPLYYVHAPGILAWASERKALAEVARSRGAPVLRVQPGEMLTFQPGKGLLVEEVERLAAPAVDVVDFEEAVQGYQQALERAIRRRTRGLRRAAVFFSGGVDSVLVAELVRRAGVEVTGYVAGVEGSGDVRVAIEVGKAMGLPVKVAAITEARAEAELPRVLEAAELHGPVQAEVSLPMWFAARMAHEDGHRVVFTGQAADELFAGYDWYRDVLAQHGPLTLHARMWEDIRTLPLDTLEREDRIAMAWSLENRAPFLDADVIRWAMRIAPHLKIHGPDDVQRKHPHRALAERVGVPRSVAYREKSMAQDGSNVHALLEGIARRRFPAGAPVADVPDFGSNYRYRHTLEGYAAPEVRALLAQVVEEHGIVVAEQDGTALPPRATPALVGAPGRRARPPQVARR